jgi:hypothetical protein
VAGTIELIEGISRPVKFKSDANGGRNKKNVKILRGEQQPGLWANGKIVLFDRQWPICHRNS